MSLWTVYCYWRSNEEYWIQADFKSTMDWKIIYHVVFCTPFNLHVGLLNKNAWAPYTHVVVISGLAKNSCTFEYFYLFYSHRIVVLVALILIQQFNSDLFMFFLLKFNILIAGFV